MDKAQRLYNELSWIWELWGDPKTEYALFSSYLYKNLQAIARKKIESILVLGCGGGKNVFTLKTHAHTTGLDLSPDMLKLARKLNPGCDFVLADMRTFDLGKTYDAIVVDDAVSYMLSEDDLTALFASCYKHLEPNGVLSVGPDICKENFVQNRCDVFHSISHPDYPGTQIVYITNDYDPNPEDNTYETSFIYLIRQNGKLTIETDLHTLGIFKTETWSRLLIKNGFSITESTYSAEEGEYQTYFCSREA